MKMNKEKVLALLLELEELINTEKDKDQIKKLKSKYTKLNNSLKKEE